MDTQMINTPEKLHQAIGKFLHGGYSHDDLVKMCDDARKCAIGFRGDYSALPVLPAYKGNPLDGLQDVMDWCIKSSEVVDDIVSNLERDTVVAVISQLKKLKDFVSRVLSLVNSELREEAQKEARAIVEKEYKNLNEKAARLKTDQMLLIRQEEAVREIELEALQISRRETKELVEIYLSKDPAFEARISQMNNEVNEVLEAINRLVGSNTPTGKLFDIYCKLKDIPLQQQFDAIGYVFCPIDDLADVICGGCNRLYASVDNVIKTFEEIQTRAEQKKAADKKAGGEKTDLAGLKIAETGRNAKRIVAAILTSAVMILLFELVVYFGPVTWLKDHPHSYGLQGGITFLILCVLMGLFVPQWRKWCWGMGVLPLLVLILSLLGGRSSR